MLLVVGLRLPRILVFTVLSFGLHYFTKVVQLLKPIVEFRYSANEQ